jgi:NADH:ubiquinone oxidoreductase subunit F (NADH-binding)
MTLGRGSWPGFGRETANDFFHEGVPGAFVAGLDHALGPDLGGAQPAPRFKPPSPSLVVLACANW